MSQSNPRKRTAQAMLFQRALFGLNTRNSKNTSNPPAKRARVVVQKNSISQQSNKEFNESHSRSSANRYSSNDNRNRTESFVSFNSFSNAPPRDSSHNLLHDRHRGDNNNNNNYRHHNNNNNDYLSNNARFGRGVGSRHRDIQTKKRRHGHHSNYDNYGNDNYGNDNYDNHDDRYNGGSRKRYNGYDRYNNNNYYNDKHRNSNNKRNAFSQQKIEQCRMKKLWTDFIGSDESVFKELRFCQDTSFFITSNSIAHKISQVIKILFTEYLKHENVVFNDKIPLKLLDGLSCIGGNTYSFAKIFDSINHDIYANELDSERYHALKHNMKTFEQYGIISNNDKKDRYHFYNMDFLKLHETLGSDICNSMDIIFLDPEWNNGDDYKQTNRQQIHLFNIGELHLYQVVDRIINEWYRNIKIIAIKVAKNYDQEFLCRKFQKCQQIEDKLFRIGEISFHNQKLLVITKTFGINKNKNKKDDEDNKEEKENEEDDDLKSDLKTFEQLISDLPQMMNKSSSSNIRDKITVKILS